MARRQDPKEEALREARALNPRPEAVTDSAFAESQFLDPRDLVQVRYEMVRRVRAEGETVSAAAASFGFLYVGWETWLISFQGAKVLTNGNSLRNPRTAFL